MIPISPIILVLSPYDPGPLELGSGCFRSWKQKKLSYPNNQPKLPRQPKQSIPPFSPHREMHRRVRELLRDTRQQRDTLKATHV
jgi:hypothetical protein